MISLDLAGAAQVRIAGIDVVDIRSKCSLDRPINGPSVVFGYVLLVLPIDGYMGRDAETLFFQHTRSPEGYYFKDHRSSPGREYEFIEFESPVDVRKVRAFVNFYAGSCPGGPQGEVRIEFLNRIYTGTFAIASSEGNQGRSGPSQSDFWTQIPIREILRINELSPQAANASK